MDENILDYKSLKDLVYDYLRKNMENGVLKPGDLIDEKELCNKLKISRTPVREALLLLQAEGFITILPRRRMFVNELQLKDIEDIYQLVGALEGEAAVKAIDRMTEEHMNKLEKLNIKMKEALENGDFEKYNNYNWDIHDLFLKLNGNKILTRIVHIHKKRLYCFPHIMKKGEMQRKKIPEWDAHTMKYHLKMAELCRKRDKNGLRKLIQERHWCFEEQRCFMLPYYDEQEV